MKVPAVISGKTQKDYGVIGQAHRQPPAAQKHKRVDRLDHAQPLFEVVLEPQPIFDNPLLLESGHAWK